MVAVVPFFPVHYFRNPDDNRLECIAFDHALQREIRWEACKAMLIATAPQFARHCPMLMAFASDVVLMRDAIPLAKGQPPLAAGTTHNDLSEDDLIVMSAIIDAGGEGGRAIQQVCTYIHICNIPNECVLLLFSGVSDVLLLSCTRLLVRTMLITRLS